jgi:exopolysaccharide biosynthesis polyprenyl glycosylphosphotransferase
MNLRVDAPDALRIGAGWVTEAEVGRSRYQASVKPILDRVLAALLLLITMPFWLAIAIAIKLDSPGPAIFVQQRLGLNGRPFRFYKFRSMYVDAERRLHELGPLNEMDGPVFKMQNDPRVTRFGRTLRRTSLDELPQLINVLLGNMSLVGPRPALPGEVERYRPGDGLRLRVKPGLTCLWQIRGRSNCNFDQWMAYDREYIERLSLGLDLSILLRTVLVVLNHQGAY